MRRLALLGLLCAAVALAGCGGASEPEGAGPANADHAAAKRQIKQREEAALPPDNNFVGDPAISVSCSGQACTARLTSDLATDIPLGKDRWRVADDGVRLVGGSNIVGFMAADDDLACMNREADTGSLKPLLPCTAVVAHKRLP